MLMQHKNLNPLDKRLYISWLYPLFSLLSAQYAIYHLDFIWQVLLGERYTIIILAFPQLAYERQRSKLHNNHRGADNRQWYILS